MFVKNQGLMSNFQDRGFKSRYAYLNHIRYALSLLCKRVNPFEPLPLVARYTLGKPHKNKVKELRSKDI